MKLEVESSQDTNGTGLHPAAYSAQAETCGVVTQRTTALAQRIRCLIHRPRAIEQSARRLIHLLDIAAHLVRRRRLFFHRRRDMRQSVGDACTAPAISPSLAPSPVTDSASVSAWAQATLISVTA